MTRRQRKHKLPELIELQVTALSHDGRGIASRDGKCVFIEGALPGEQVVTEINRHRARFDEGKLRELISRSPSRVSPQCPQAGVCGGCSLQHLAHAEQIRLKERTLLEQLEHFGKLAPEKILQPAVGPEYGYRRKARLGVRYVVRKDQVLVGFREKGSSFITDISRCHVLDDRVGCLIQPLRDLIRSLEAYRSIPQIEVALGDDDAALVFRHLQPLSESDHNALVNFASLHKFDLYLQPGGLSSVHKIAPALGEERLHYRLEAFDLQMRFHPLDFTQVNPHINQRAVSCAVEKLAPQKTDRVLDLFCGLGNFTLPLARSEAEVVGVEGNAAMVERGMENARHNGIENATFHAADLTKPLAGQAWASAGFDKILIDPPRSGALQLVEEISRLAAQKIVYVSCNPATLARDAGVLSARGYKLVEAGVLDMFPHTAHVESIAVFDRA